MSPGARKSSSSGTENPTSSMPRLLKSAVSRTSRSGSLEGQSLQQDGVDDAEQRRGHADAERQRDERDGGEAARLEQRPQRRTERPGGRCPCRDTVSKVRATPRPRHLSRRRQRSCTRGTRDRRKCNGRDGLPDEALAKSGTNPGIRSSAASSDTARRRAPRTRARPMRLAGAKSAAHERDRRVVRERDDQAGVEHAEQALADDQPGRDQHAEPLGRSGLARAAARLLYQWPTTAPITTAKRRRHRQVDADADGERRNAQLASRRRAPRRATISPTPTSTPMPIIVPVEVAADDALRQRRDERRLRRRQRLLRDDAEVGRARESVGAREQIQHRRNDRRARQRRRRSARSAAASARRRRAGRSSDPAGCRSRSSRRQTRSP